MNLEALKAVLKALSGKCQDDMVDRFSSPEEKMESALADASEGDEEGEDDELENIDPSEDDPQVAAEEALEEEDEDPVKADLKNFFRSKKPEPPRPGTAVMIAVDKKKGSAKRG